MDMRVIPMMRNRDTKRNPIARLLKHFTPKRFKDKTKYERKKYVSFLIGMSIGIVIGFSVYHYFFMDKFSCCGVYG